MLRQCEKKGTKIKSSLPFLVGDEEELYISSNNFLSVQGWNVTQTGRLQVISKLHNNYNNNICNASQGCFKFLAVS